MRLVPMPERLLVKRVVRKKVIARREYMRKLVFLVDFRAR